MSQVLLWMKEGTALHVQGLAQGLAWDQTFCTLAVTFRMTEDSVCSLGLDRDGNASLQETSIKSSLSETFYFFNFGCTVQ